MSDGITIDNLRINVESNASAASGAIQGFVDDLEKLKSAVARNNAAKNLTSLADSLKGFSDVSNPTNKLAGLATELEKLKNIGSVRTVANSLNSITETLGRLKGVSDDQITVAASAITRIAEAMRSFDGMKISGVSTTIKSLGEIGTVTEKLSDETLAKFESKVKRVSEILTPLTTKATSLSSALRTIDSSAKTASTGIEKVTGVAERQALTLASLVGAWYGIRRVYNIISRMISKAVEDAVEWDGVSERFLRGFGSNAQTAYSWIERLNQEMGLNKQQFMQYTSIYAQMLEGLGVVTEDAYKMALGYSELTYDIWAGYNDVFKSYDDAAKAIQSAISGNTRAIRRAGFSVLNTTLAQTAANHGLEISISGATEAEKSYLRYLALVDQAHQTNIIGTYAQEMNTAEGALRTLAQETKSFGQALGSLFIPLLQGAIPVLTAVVQLASDAVHYIASLFGIQIQTIDWDASRYTAGVADYADELDDVADAYGAASGAAEKYKRTILGIDEINPLNAKNTGGGGGGGGSSSASDSGITDWGLESVWTDSIFDKITSKVKDIKAELEKIKPIIEGLGIASLVVAADAIGNSLAAANPLWKFLGEAIVLGVDFGLNIAFTEAYVESGDILMLLLEALTTGLGSFISYKILGTGGIALTLGVSVIAQIMGMSAAIKDGADFSWTQAIFTALEGAGAGVAAAVTFGAEATGIVISAAAGLMLTVGVMAIVVSQAVFERAVQEDLASRFGDVTLTAEQIKVLVNDITLYGMSGEQQENYIRTSEELTIFADAKLELDNVHADVENLNELVNSMFYQYSIGISIDQGEFEDAIQDYIDAGQEYLNQHYLTTKLAITAFDLEGTHLDDSNEAFLSVFSEQAESLGEQLKAIVAEGFMDGEWIPDKLEQAQKLYKELQEILNTVSEYEYKAKLKSLELDLGDDFTFEAYQEALQEAIDATQERINQSKEGRTQLLIAAEMQFDLDVQNGVENAEELYNETVARIQEEYRNQVIEAKIGTIRWAIDQIEFRYDDVASDPNGVFNLDTMLGLITDESSHYDTMNEVFREVASDFNALANEYGPAVRESMLLVVNATKPTLEDFEEVAAECRALGYSVPDEIRTALNDFQRLAALAGDAEGLDYMVGYALTQSDAYTSMLSDVEGAFWGITDKAKEGLLNNTDFVIDAGTGIIVGVRDAMTGEISYMNQTMQENLEYLGVDMGQVLGENYSYIYEGSTGALTAIWDASTNTIKTITPVTDNQLAELVQQWGGVLSSSGFYIYDATGKVIIGIYDAATGTIREINKPIENAFKGLGDDMILGLVQPITQNGDKVPHLFEEIGNDSIDALRESVDSHSPSKAFDSIGQDIMSGLTSPLESGSSSYNTLERTMTTLGSDMMTTLSDTFTESKLSSIGSSIIGGITGGMKNLDIPNFHIDWTQAYKEFTVLGKTMKMYIPWPNISFYAQGGFPNAGELFMARESGNEFVGRVGNKSAVANNDQIVEAIARGVADAMQQGNSLLQEQNGLLREMGRNTGGGGYITAGSIVNGLNQKNRRDGRSVVVLGV